MRPSGKISSWNPLSKITKKKKGDELPETMAVIWSDTVLEKPGSAPVRGFGGRVFFYDKDNQPVTADGELVVYGFDNEAKSSEGPKADRKYVFREDEFQSHFSDSKLGPSYSVWVPWEKIGGIRKSIALIPMFRTSDGRVIKSAQSINVLPGRVPKSATASNALDISGVKKISGLSKVQQVGFDPASTNGGVSQADHVEEQESMTNLGRVRTTTISLPPTLANKMLSPIQKDDRSDLNVAKTRTDKTASPNQSDERHSTANRQLENTVEAASPKRTQEARHRPVFGKPGAFR